MNAWFAYVLGLSELIYGMKLEVYEEACASLVLLAAGVCNDAEQEPPSAKAEEGQREEKHTDSNSTANSPATTAPTAATTTTRLASSPVVAAVQAIPHTASPKAGNEAPPPHDTSPSSLTTASTSSAGARSSSATGVMVDRKASASSHAVSAAGHTSAPSSVAAVGALLDAMQLRKPMRGSTSRSQLLDDIQAEANLVYHELDAVYALQPEDVATAAHRPHSPPSPPSPCPEVSQSGENHRHSSGSRCSFSASTRSNTNSKKPISPTPNNIGNNSNSGQLLYGELTSTGVRQLHAISVASVCVTREGSSSSGSGATGGVMAAPPSLPPRSQSYGCSNAPPSSMSNGGMAGSYGTINYTNNTSGAYMGGSSHRGGGTSLLAASVVPHGAVVMGVDVGSGNGRLLFEWARLATATCKRRPDGSRHRGSGEELNSGSTPGSATTATASNTANASSGNTYAAASRRSNLLAATMAPLGVPTSSTVWRGWVGVGIEMMPSRMRIARRALLPHYLNMKPALLVPVGAPGLLDGDKPRLVSRLDPVAPEAIAVTPGSGSFSSPNSLHSNIAARAVPAAAAESPASAAVSRALVDRVPQPTARVLLYEGDALELGVLSNATLCCFPNLVVRADSLSLLRSGRAASASAGYDLVNGLGGEQIGSFGASAGYHTSSLGAAGNGNSAPSPYRVSGAAATAAAMNSAFLNSTAAGAHGGRIGGTSLLEASVCSATSNASSISSSRGSGSASNNYYRLCRVEHGPSITGKEDPHLVVFCSGLGFDEGQVRRLCQRLEDMLLRRSRPTVSSPPASQQRQSAAATSHERGPSGAALSEDESLCQRFNTASTADFSDVASPMVRNSSSYSDDNSDALEELNSGFDARPATPTAAEATGYGISMRDESCDRHWESVTCVMLLRPMDVLASNFPLFRYAARIYETQQLPIAPEDTGVLLYNGSRADGTAAPYYTRGLPTRGTPEDFNVANSIQESDVWTTTLETTWMNAAPAWVVRFRF